MIHYESNFQWFLLLTLLLLLISWKNCLAIKIKLHKQNKNHKSWPNITSLRSYSPWNNTTTKSLVPLIILEMFNSPFKENEKVAYSLCYVFHSDFLYGAVPFIVNQTFGLVQPLYSKSDHLRELVAFTKTCRIKDQSNKQTNYIGWGIVLVRVTIRFLKMLIPLTNVDHRRMAGKTYFPGRSGSEPARKLLMCHIKALNTDSLVFSCTSRIQIKWLFLKRPTLGPKVA